MLSLNEFISKFNIRLTKQQLDAVTALDRPTLLLAVPGSGKTTTLVTRVGYMVYVCGIQPDKILVMTYTRAAAADMKERFRKVFGSEYADRLRFSTINSVCYDIIREYKRDWSRNDTAPFVVLNEKETLALVRECYIKVQGEFPADYDIQQVKNTITFIKNMQIPKEKIDAAFEGSDYKVKELYLEYEKALLQRHQMDFDDQIVYTYRILRQLPAFLSMLHDRYQYILVDEAQDTSKIQHEVIAMLSGLNSKESQNIFMVGDEDQSIYGFRAAYPQALLDFKQNYRNAQVLLLEQNFRSTPEIVRLAGSFIRNNKDRYEKKMFTKNISGRPIDKVSIFRENQYEYLLQQCQNAEKQTAILFRNNSSAVPIIYHFLKDGIGCSWKEKDNVFFTSPSVLKICDILRLFLNNRDIESFLKVYYKLGLLLKKEEAQEAAEICLSDMRRSIFSAALSLPDLSSRKRERLQFVSALFRKYDECDVSIILEAIEENFIDDVDQEAMFLLKSIAEPDETIEAFLEKLVLLKNIIAEGSPESGNIILSTIHSSKGLEYDRVIFVDIIDPIFAMDKRRLGETGYRELMEEDRRLFYVAVTRAKHELSIVETEYAPFIDEFMGISIRRDRSFLSNVTSRIPISTSEKGRKGISSKGSPADEYIKRKKNAEKTGKKDYTSGPSAIHPGTRVIHKQYGTGRIISVDDVYVEIFFVVREETKKFHIEKALESGLLKILK